MTVTQTGTQGVRLRSLWSPRGQPNAHYRPHIAPLVIVPLVFLAVTALFAWKLMFTGLTVIGYDTMNYMYPYRVFAAEALREGRIPLWNPWIFFGVPFLANLQSAVFYPLHLLFLIMPAPYAMNASVVLHFFLAAWFTALTARGMVGLDWWSAVVAGMIYAFSGFVGSQVGHLNQLNAAAWLPLALLTTHYAITTHGTRWAIATGVVLAVQLLAGHAQETYMTVVAVGAYGAFHVAVTGWSLLMPSRAPSRDAVGIWAQTITAHLGAIASNQARRSDLGFRGSAAIRWRAWWRHALWCGALIGLAGMIAGGFAAPQVLPTTELTAASIRASGMTFGEAISFSLPPRELFVGLLPTFGLAAPTSNEFLGWVGFTGAMLALTGVTFRVRHPVILFFALLALLSLLLALGNHTPIYGHIFRLPGMNLFRVPARWLFLTTLAGAIVAGAGFSFLRAPTPEVHGTVAPRPWFRVVAASRLLLAVIIATTAASVIWPLQFLRTSPDAGLLIVVWGSLGIGAVFLIFVVLAMGPSRVWSAVLTIATVTELWVASTAHEYNNPNPPGVYTDSRPVIDALRHTLPAGRVLSVARTGYQPFDAPRIQGTYGNVLGIRGVEAGLINTKYKDTLNPNLSMVFGIPVVDGYDGGVLPVRRYVDFKGLIVPPDRNQPDGLLRDQLSRERIPDLPEPARLRQWGVTYLLRDTIDDRQIDDAYFDTDGASTLRTEQAIVLPGPVLALPTVLARSDLPPDVGASSVTIDPSDLDAGRPRMRDVHVVAIVATHRQPDPLPGATIVVTIRGMRNQTVWTGQVGVAPLAENVRGVGTTVARLSGDIGSRPAYILRLPINATTDDIIGSVTIRASQPAIASSSLLPHMVGDLVGVSEASARLPGNRVGVDEAQRTASTDRSQVAEPMSLASGEPDIVVHAITLVGDGKSWPVPQLHSGDAQLVHRSDVKLYRLIDSPDRVRVATQAVIVSSDGDALRALIEAPDDATSVVVQRASETSTPPSGGMRASLRALRDRGWELLGRVFETGEVASADLPLLTRLRGSSRIEAKGAASAIVEADRPEAMRIRYVGSDPGIVVVRDTWFGGWRATVDGRPAPIWRADLMFRAVPVEAGDHVVELLFQQQTLETGIGIAFATLVLVIAMLAHPATSADRRRWPPLANTNVEAVPGVRDERLSAAVTGVEMGFAWASGRPPEEEDDEGVFQPDITLMDIDDSGGGLYISRSDADPEVAREMEEAPIRTRTEDRERPVRGIEATSEERDT